MITTVKVSSKGQIVLPIDIREKISIKQGDVLLLHLVGDKIIIEPIKKTTKKIGRKFSKKHRVYCRIIIRTISMNLELLH